jgi:hypothetical protein
MKLNKETLKKIIKEELLIVLGEARIRPINPLGNVPDGPNKDKIKKLIDQGGDWADQGYELATATQDPSMGQPYEGTNYPDEEAEYLAVGAIGAAWPHIGEYAMGLKPRENSRFSYKHVDKMRHGTVEVDYEDGRGGTSMNIILHFGSEEPISLYDAASDLAFAYIDLNLLNYSQDIIQEVMSNIEIGLKKMLISGAQKLIFRSKEAAHYFGVKAMHNPVNIRYPSDELGGSGVFRGVSIWYDYGKYSPPNEQEIAQKLKSGTIVINN